MRGFNAKGTKNVKGFVEMPFINRRANSLPCSGNGRKARTLSRGLYARLRQAFCDSERLLIP